MKLFAPELLECLTALVEVHDEAETTRAVDAGATAIAVLLDTLKKRGKGK